MPPLRLTALCGGLLLLLAWSAAAQASDPLPAPSLPEPWKENPREDAVLSPDGKLLVYANPVRSGCAVFLIDRKTDREVRRIELRAALDILLGFTPDEKRLLISLTREVNPRGVPGIIPAVQVCDIKTGEMLCRFNLQFNQGRGRALYGISDRVLVVAGQEEVATVYDLVSGKDLGDFPGKHRAKAVALTRDGRWFITAGKDDSLCLWDVSRRALVKQLAPAARPIAALAVSADGKWFATLEREGPTLERGALLRVFDRQKFAEGASAPTMLLTHSCAGLRFTPDGLTLIANGAGLRNGLAVWDWQASRSIRGGYVEPRKMAHTAYKREFGVILAAHLASDGRTLLTVGPSDHYCVWDIKPLAKEEPTDPPGPAPCGK